MAWEDVGLFILISVLSLFPSSPHFTESKLRSGVDVLVGTPGRIKDHLERRNLTLNSLE